MKKEPWQKVQEAADPYYHPGEYAWQEGYMGWCGAKWIKDYTRPECPKCRKEIDKWAKGTRLRKTRP
jgi:hypothetical protein